MNYKFSINKYIDPESGIEKLNPIMDIENQENYGWFFYDEINNLTSNLHYVKEIVSKLELVLNAELDYYEGFGYEQIIKEQF